MKDEKGEYLYNIVVITDEKNENDFYLKKRIVRAYLPHFYKSKRSKYINRLHAWHEVLRQYDVDIVVSSMWHDNVTFWDALSVKSFYTKPAFCIHFHSLNFYQYASRNLSPIDQAAIYSICDGVIALTECDKKYISSYNKITTAILNPLTFNANNIKNIYNTNNNIIWCARIAAQKQPLDVVEAIKIVAKIIPDVKLYMVGGAENSQYVNELKNLINKYKLEDNICVVGFTNNVEDYYRKCSLMVHTAEYEGYGLVLAEGLFWGLPIVCYDMPYLQFIEDGRGFITVQQGDYNNLAAQIIKVLTNEQYKNQKINEVKEHVKALCRLELDIAEKWKDFFKLINSCRKIDCTSSQEEIAFREIVKFHNKLRMSYESEIQELRSIQKYINSRIDLKLLGKDSDFIVKISDGVAKISIPNWLQNNGRGYSIISGLGYMEISIKFITKGTFVINLMGMDIEELGKRIPYWIDYTKFSINGENKLDKSTPAWHDKPITYSCSVNAGDRFTLYVEWQSHRNTRDNTIYLTDDNKRNIVDEKEKMMEIHIEQEKKKVDVLKKAIKVLMN